VAEIFVSYTAEDKGWADWIGLELERLGYKARLFDWEVSAGGNVANWMVDRHDEADHVLCIISPRYLDKTKRYSAWERLGALLAAVDGRTNFVLPVLVEPSELPTLLAQFKRCDLYGLGEEEAKARIANYLKPAGKPSTPLRFPGANKGPTTGPKPTESKPTGSKPTGSKPTGSKPTGSVAFPGGITRQLVVIHLSDIHFGKFHRFRAGHAIGEGDLPSRGFPRLIDTLKKDFQGSDVGCPVIVCITGDFAEIASPEEFREAEKFIKEVAKEEIFGCERGLENIFVVPGNHDLIFGAAEIEDRWGPWSTFYQNTFGKASSARDPESRFSFHNRVSDLGAIVVCLNSAEYVKYGSPDAKRGSIDQEQLTQLRRFLKSIPPEELNSAIRIALIHHHPILIPALAESEQGYDAVSNAGYLLNELRSFGFQLVLHGHKHRPYHFSEDSFAAFRDKNSPPILVVAGGSVSSTELPPAGHNCYNRLTIKWNPNARQGRILLSTRGLNILEGGREILPAEWEWVDRLIDDRQYLGGPRAPQTIKATSREHSKDDATMEASRSARYQDLRFNMPVCEVMPSLVSGQHNEVRLWIEVHRPDEQTEGQKPTQVTWSAGKRHEVITVRREDDGRYCATMHYWGPMLVQAKLEFSSGEPAYGYVYARMPSTYQRPEDTIDVG
jgi:3',5'-cyclic AMP phosphodiesterase CpdA